MWFQGLRRGSPFFLFLVFFFTLALAAAGLPACSSTGSGGTGPPVAEGTFADEIPAGGPVVMPAGRGEEPPSPADRTGGDSTPLLDIDGAVDSLADQIADSMTGGGKRVVAVLDFASIRDESPSSSFFGRFLAEELVSRLFLSGRFEVIERRLLDKVMEEQKLSTSDLADEKSIAELGKLLGADAVLTGTCADMGTEIRANGRLISIESGRLFAVARARIRKDDRVAALNEGGEALPSRGEEASAPKEEETAAVAPAASREGVLRKRTPSGSRSEASRVPPGGPAAGGGTRLPMEPVAGPAARPPRDGPSRKALRNFLGSLRRPGDGSAGPRPFPPGVRGRRIGSAPPDVTLGMKVERIRELYMERKILEAAKVVRAVLSDPAFDRAATAFDLGWVSFVLTEAAWDQRKTDPKAAGLVWEETERMARRAMAMDSREPMAFCALGQVLLRRGRRDEALADFDRALKLDPQCRKLPPRIRDAVFADRRGPGGSRRGVGD